MSFENQITGPTKRLTDNTGRDIEVYNYTRDGTDSDYGDPQWKSDGGETVTGRIEFEKVPAHVTSPDGAESDYDTRFFVPDTVTVRAPGSDTDERATELVDVRADERYEAVGVFHESNGLLRVKALSVND